MENILKDIKFGDPCEFSYGGGGGGMLDLKLGGFDFGLATPCSDVETTIRLYDSFGDGWNGADITITNEAGDVVYYNDFPDGSEIVDTIITQDEQYSVVVTSGDFPSEISWEIEVNGNLVIQGGADTTGSFNPCEIDTEGPVIQDKTITVTNVTYDSADLEFNAATDEGSGIDRYELYVSEANNVCEHIFENTNEINTAFPDQEFSSAGLKSDVTIGFSYGTYWANIIAYDNLGNRTYYSPVEINLLEDTQDPTSTDLDFLQIELAQSGASLTEVTFRSPEDNVSSLLAIKKLWIASTVEPLDTLQNCLDKGVLYSYEGSTESSRYSNRFDPAKSYNTTVLLMDLSGNVVKTKTITDFDPYPSKTVDDPDEPPHVPIERVQAEFIDDTTANISYVEAFDFQDQREDLTYSLYINDDITQDFNSVSDIETNGTLVDSTTGQSIMSYNGFDANTTYNINIIVENSLGLKSSIANRRIRSLC